MRNMARLGSILRPAALAALAAGLGACTIVRVSDGRGVRTSYYPGVAVIQITRPESVQVVEVESIGAAVVGNRANFGWSHSQIALVPPGRCQFIAWRTTRALTAELRALFGPGTEICDREGGLQ
ncbi:MAG: hypothetical protein H7Y62_04195 [Hyphomicrobium sp.]|nr:hypothetical protein [Hyphomicrobium sp.]